jgi:uncharacterized membrane protein YciS (DUF1049 family)
MKKASLNRNKDIDFLAAQRKLHELSSEQSGSLYFYVLILIGVLLITGAFYGKLKFDESQIQKQIDALNGQITDPANIDQLTRANLLKNDIQKLKQIKTMIEEGLVVLDEIGSFSTDPMVAAIELKPTNVTLDYFDFSNTVFSITAHSRDYTVFSSYAMDLKDSPIFESVYYSSYTYDEGEDYYIITYICTLEGGN